MMLINGNSKNNICLTGYMGSGKSTVGRLLSERLGLCFADTDAMIVKRKSRSISEIFKIEGEGFFRQLETELLRELAGDEGFRDTVLATGGGIVIRPENRSDLKRIGTVIYLRARPDILYERVKNDTERPLLNTDDVPGRISDMLKIRTPMYEDAADHILDTDALDAEETAEAVIDIILSCKLPG